MQPIEPKQLGDVFLHEEYERIHAQMSQEFQQQVSLEQLKQIAHPFQEGITGYTLQATVPIGDGQQQYLWLDQSGTKGLSSIFDQQQKIGGFKLCRSKLFHRRIKPSPKMSILPSQTGLVCLLGRDQ
ncbi:hypothetical protein ACLMAB_28470 [Brevibacillus laterosporus]